MKNDQIFTPECIVNKMLDDIGYSDKGIEGKTIFEPSFGDGAFLAEIVRRIIHFYVDSDIPTILNALSLIYGMEINKDNYERTIKRLNQILNESHIPKYSWDHLICGDTLLHYGYGEQHMGFDYIVGNPPYMRFHHLGEDTRNRMKSFRFCSGTSDLYVVFFEKCIDLLNNNDNGKLCFITPNAYFKTSSQKKFREYLATNRIVKSIWDYGKVNVFDAGIYTAVTLLDRRGNGGKVRYALMDSLTAERYSVFCDAEEILTKRIWCFNNEEDNQFLRKIRNRPVKLGDLCRVQNAVATNADSLYVVSADTVSAFGLELVRPAVKASTLNNEDFIIFPYSWDEAEQMYKIIPESDMENKYPNTYSYLLSIKKVLDTRNMDGSGEWYRYARSQGIQASRKNNIALKHFIPADGKSCAEWLECGTDAVAYSGIIITAAETNMPLVKQILNDHEFGRYLSLVEKDVVDGYKTFNTTFVRELFN